MEPAAECAKKGAIRRFGLLPQSCPSVMSAQASALGPFADWLLLGQQAEKADVRSASDRSYGLYR
jgi:hypothetical protein